MSYYDIFYKNEHSPLMGRIMLSLNRSLLTFLLARAGKQGELSVLEIGPGKGYFYRACADVQRVCYSAVDRNWLMLSQLGIQNVYEAECPQLPDFPSKFDIIYAAFVIEHLKSGQEIYSLIYNCQKNLAPGGMIVFQCPDVLGQKGEFWNMDYTHLYPTTKRNVAMAFYENGIQDVRIIPISGLLTNPHLFSPLAYRLLHLFTLFYDYRVASFLARPFYRKQTFELDNVFYRLYCFAKQETLLVIARPH
jgi:Methyltransferase domain